MKKKAERENELTVIFLEDEPRDCEIIRELLLDAGYDLSMDCTEKEETYVTMLRGRPYDIILADFKLPGFDAFAALRLAIEICPRVPFICISGTIGEETAVELLKAGAVDYILKDRLARLPSAINRALAEGKEKEKRRLAEVEIRKLNEELEQRVRDRTTQLETANKELEAFSYSVSHDLRAPLRAIDGFSQLLFERIADGDAETQRLLGLIRQNSRHMTRLIDDLLALSRIGRQDIRLARVEMTAMARAVFAELLPPGEQPRVQLQISDLPAIQGDTSLMHQIWINLIDNAIKFSAKSQLPLISISGRVQEGMAVFAICDNGVGFDMKHAHRLFGVFQRLHSLEEFPGTGVGLAIVERIVTRHGGRVWVEAATGEGATFFFSLPLSAGAG